jgi:TRAP-type C4-dicarboxylate transport system permease small subunit
VSEPTSSDRAWAAAHRRLTSIARAGSWVCGALLLGVSIIVLAEVLGRNFFGARWHGAEELAGYVFAITVAWGFAYCLVDRNHIRLDFVYQSMSRAWQRAWDIVSLAALFVFAAFLAWKAWGTLHESWVFDSVSTKNLQVPLWIPQGLWALSFGFFALSALFLLVYAIRLALRRRLDELRAVAGIPNAAQHDG